MNKSETGEIFRDYPVSLWVIGLIFFAGGIYFFYRGFSLPFLLIGIGVGLLMVILSTVLTVELLDGGRTLVLLHQGLLKRDRQELEVREIQSIFVQQSPNRDRDSSATYRVVIRMKNGEQYPLRGYFSSGYQAKEKTARTLRETIGVAGQDQTPMGVMQMAAQMVQDAYQVGGQNLEEMEEQETRGVRWKIQTVTLGPTPVTRWLSSDFSSPGQFLYIVQKLEDQESGKMVMSLMGKTLMRKSLQMYGFKDEDLPNLDSAVVMENLDKRMEKFYLGYTSDGAWAQHILNAWVVMPLVGWASDHPLQQGVKNPEDFSQLAVLFSPSGVFVSCLGELSELEREQLIDLGVEIVRAHGG
jgi:hypothetical protein